MIKDYILCCNVFPEELSSRLSLAYARIAEGRGGGRLLLRAEIRKPTYFRITNARLYESATLEATVSWS